MNKYTISISLIIISFIASGNSWSRDYKKECQEVAKYAIANKYSALCSLDYHLFNAKPKKSLNIQKEAKAQLKIAEFNAYHPGMAKTRFKDYQKIASLINKWDIIGMTELLPLVSDDLTHNNNLVKFIEITAPGKIDFYQKSLKDIQRKLKKTKSNYRRKSLLKKLNIKEKMITFYKAEIKKAKAHYRKPGYLKILDELHKLKNGKRWALVLSPIGEAAKVTDVHELVGYFYKSDMVKPYSNEYCKKTAKSKVSPFACIPTMDKKILGQDKNDVFSRRPFMASFKAKSFNFTLLTSHVIYTSPKDHPELVSNILQKSFGVDHWKELSTGINGGNFARFAEVKVTLELIQKLRTKYKQKDIIYMGDLNLNHKNKFWNQVLSAAPGFELYVEEKTSLSKARYNSNMEETNGFSNDFDHFLFDPSHTNECLGEDAKANVKVENFYKGATGRYVKRLYEVRTKRINENKYEYNKAKYKRLLDKFVAPFENGEKTIMKIGNKKIIVSGKAHSVKGLIKDKRAVNLITDFFQHRVLDSQLADQTYYVYYANLLSDHMPIVLTCNI